jgi:large subunit ribosomal protein L35
MPKLKTNAGSKKRFKLTGTGKVKRKHAFVNHILTKKSPGRKARLGKFGLVDKTDMNRISDLLRI